MKKIRKFKKGDIVRYLGDKKRRRWTSLKNKEIYGVVKSYDCFGNVYWKADIKGKDSYYFDMVTKYHYSPERLLEKVHIGDSSEEL